MPEGVGYGPQSTVSVGKNLNVIGNHAYGYSGIIAATGSADILLSFTSGNYYFVGTWVPIYASDAGDNAKYKINMNGTTVWTTNATSAITATFSTGNDVMIPPFTEVEFTGEVANNRGIGVVLVGRIYGKIV